MEEDNQHSYHKEQHFYQQRRILCDLEDSRGRIAAGGPERYQGDHYR